jgi:hypothetical protein
MSATLPLREGRLKLSHFGELREPIGLFDKRHQKVKISIINHVLLELPKHKTTLH